MLENINYPHLKLIGLAHVHGWKSAHLSQSCAIFEIMKQSICAFSLLYRYTDKRYSQKSIPQSTFVFWQPAQFMSDCLLFDFPLFTASHTICLICYFLHSFPVLSANNKWTRNVFSGKAGCNPVMRKLSQMLQTLMHTHVHP